MNTELLRLFLPVGAGVLLGLSAAFRGFLRARSGAPDCPGFVLLVSGLAGASPLTKLAYAAILAFAAAQPPPGPGVPIFQKAAVFLVAGNVMGLMAFAQGLVAAARMPKMLAVSPEDVRQDIANGSLGPAGRPGAIPITMMILGAIETPAIFAMIGGMIALSITN